MRFLAIESPYLVIGLDVKIERLRVGRKPRPESVTLFPSRGLVKRDALPLDIEGIHFKFWLRRRPYAGEFPGVINARNRSVGNIIVEAIWQHAHGTRIKHIQCVARRCQRSPNSIESPADVCEIRHANQTLGAKNNNLPAAAEREIRVRGKREGDVNKCLMNINFINVTCPRPADAALLRGANSLNEYPHIRTQMQVRVGHHPEQVVSVRVLGTAAKQVVLEIFVSITHLSA